MSMILTPGRMLAFMACCVLLGIKIACTNGVYSPLILGVLAFLNACQLYSNRARAAALWLCFWTFLDALIILEWQLLILTPLSFTALRLSDWRTPKPIHPLLWGVNVGIVIMALVVSPNFR
jgi:hypothetical protein